MRATILFVFAVLLAVGGVSTQSPTPIVVQAASATAATSTTSVPAADVHSIPDAIKLPEQIKAANDEALAKQKAALERLDDCRTAPTRSEPSPSAVRLVPSVYFFFGSILRYSVAILMPSMLAAFSRESSQCCSVASM